MRYRNVQTGIVVDMPCGFSGKNWIPEEELVKSRQGAGLTQEIKEPETVKKTEETITADTDTNDRKDVFIDPDPEVHPAAAKRGRKRA